MKWTRWALLALFLLAFALRVYRLDFQSIWTDEGFVASLASRSLPELLAVWSISPQESYSSLSHLGTDLVGLAAETDIHPPLYYFLIHFWTLLAGSGEFALRFPAVFFGVLIIPLLFVLGKRVLGPKAAFLAAAFAALSPFYLDFSQQVRMYTLVTFLAVLSMYSFHRAFEDGRRPWWIVHSLSTGLALYTHYFAVTVAVVQAILILVGVIRAWRGLMKPADTRGGNGTYGVSPHPTPGGQGRPPVRLEEPDGQGRPPLFATDRPSTLDSRLRLWLCSQAGALLLLAPWVPFALRQVLDYQNRSLLSPDWQTVLPRTWQAFNLGLSVDSSQMLPVVVAILAVALVGLALFWWRVAPERTSLTALLLYLLLPLLVGLAIFRIKPMFHPKYFMMASPAYYLLLGAAGYGLWRSLRWGALLPVVFVFASLAYAAQAYYFDARYWKDDTRAVARYLEDRAAPQDLVLSDLVEPLSHYYRGQAPAYYLPGEEETAPQRLASLARGGAKVFLLHYEHAYTDAQDLIPFLLEREGDKLGEKGFRGYTVREYRLRQVATFVAAQGISGQGAVLEDKLALEGSLVGAAGSEREETESLSVASGGRIWATLGWRLDTPTAANYKASLSLIDERGHVAAQSDRVILRGMDPTSHWMPGERARNYYILPVFPGVVPGEYKLSLRVYEDFPSPQPGAGGPGVRFLGDEVSLGRVGVTSPPGLVEISSQDMGTPSRVQLGPLEGLGYTLARRQYQPGETIALTLFLRATEAMERDYRLRFQLRDSQGVVRWQWNSSLAYPTSRWKKGDGIRDWQDLPMSGRLSPGEYRLWMGIVPAANEPLDLPWDLGSIQVLDRPRLFVPPPVSQPLRAELDGKVALLGYDLEGEFRPGGTLRLSLYWQALKPMDESYTVFAHLIDLRNRIWAQHDGIPARDNPTSGWLKGEVLVDKHVLTIRGDAQPGDYVLEVGMYDALSGLRLEVGATGARVVERAIWIGEVMVR